MRIVFLGTPEFAVASLEALLDAGFDVPAVVTAPDKPAGRGRRLQETPVKRFALARGLRVLQPANLKDSNFLDQLKEIRADLQVVVAFRMLPEAVWSMPQLGTYNLHASLLPKYRGAAPINRAIMNGERLTGVTTFKLQHAVDTGNILFRETQEIGPDMTAGELHDALMKKGAALLVRTVKHLDDLKSRHEEPVFIVQDDREATHAPKIFRGDCKLNWDRAAREIHDQVRGLSPFPGSYTHLVDEAGRREVLKVFRTAVRRERSPGPNGSLETDRSTFLRVRCGEGSLDLLELQLEGKRRLGVQELLKGIRIGDTTRLAVISD